MFACWDLWLLVVSIFLKSDSLRHDSQNQKPIPAGDGFCSSRNDDIVCSGIQEFEDSFWYL